MYASPFGEGLSIKGTYLCVKNGSDEEKWLKSLSVAVGGGNSLCEGGLSFIYLYLKGVKMTKGVKKIARVSWYFIKSYPPHLSKILNTRLLTSLDIPYFLHGPNTKPFWSCFSTFIMQMRNRTFFAGWTQTFPVPTLDCTWRSEFWRKSVILWNTIKRDFNTKEDALIQ